MVRYSEETLGEELERAGWTVFHAGIPDFVCFKDGKIAFIEHKNARQRKMEPEKVFTPHQLRTFFKLNQLGYPVHIFYSDDELPDVEGIAVEYEGKSENFAKLIEKIDDKLTLKDHTFFKEVSGYGQVNIPSALRQRLEINQSGAYAMVIIIPVITENSSLSRDEAYEYLKMLVSQSERTPEESGS